MKPEQKKDVKAHRIDQVINAWLNSHPKGHKAGSSIHESKIDQEGYYHYTGFLNIGFGLYQKFEQWAKFNENNILI